VLPASAVVIVGPTASGKSAVAGALAERWPDTEIVVADAMQVYRGMDIGTASPTPAERAAVAHHAIDLWSPAQEASLVEWLGVAQRAVQAIGQRGHRPLVVGGTGLYVRALVDGLEPPGTDPAVRAELERQAAEHGTPALHRQLVALDPQAAAKMEPTNTRRVVRALEVCRSTGSPFSSFGPGLLEHPPRPFPMIGLRWPRPVLEQRIEARVHQMLDDGLLDEVRQLDAGPLGRTARQALGYRELRDHLAGRLSLDEAIALIALRTRRLAVRQERWFRRDPRIHWIDLPLDEPGQGAIADRVERITEAAACA